MNALNNTFYFTRNCLRRAWALLLVACLLTSVSFGQNRSSSDNVWTNTDQSRIGISPRIAAKKYQTSLLNKEAVSSILEQAPHQKQLNSVKGVILNLPLPNGKFEAYEVFETQIMSPVLAKKYPNIHTYVGRAVEDHSKIARLDLTPEGFHGFIMAHDGHVFIDPYDRGNSDAYMSYYKQDFDRASKGVFVEDNSFLEQDKGNELDLNNYKNTSLSTGETLRTYRLAMSTTQDYVTWAGDKTKAMAKLVITVNRVVGIYVNDLAVSMEMVDDSDKLLGIAPAGNLGGIHSAIVNAIGSNAFDVGHGVGAGGGGGVAGLGVICNSSRKGNGWTATNNPEGDPFDVDYVSHELGHQFSGNHTFNGTSGSCQGNGSQHGYEPGSATTIQGYAGICSGDNIQKNSDAYFHGYSQKEMVAHTQTGSGSGCAAKTESGNKPPQIDDKGLDGKTVPYNTPLRLTGKASDADGDKITYCWEEWDTGPRGAPNSPSGNAPIFRSYYPTPSPTRIFPKISEFLSGQQVIGEILPSYARDLNFRLTVRDNNLKAGGHVFENVSFKVTKDAGPFKVSAPNTAVTWEGGATETVTWDVANTDKAPVSCQKVEILLMIDGDYDNHVVIATDLPNNGSAEITVPNVATTKGRILVAAVDNIFLDCSDKDITIKEGVVASFSMSVDPAEQKNCAGVDIKYEVEIKGQNGFSDEVTLKALDLPNGVTAKFNPASVKPDGKSVLTISGTKDLKSDKYAFKIEGKGGNKTQTSNASFEILENNALPFTEKFENDFPLSGWTIDNPDGKITWEKYTDKDAYYKNSASVNNGDYSTVGKEDAMITTPYDFSGKDEPVATFDVAYTRFDEKSEDVLSVYYSLDCGDSWEQIYQKTKEKLETKEVDFDESRDWVPTKKDDWRTESLEVKDIKGESSVIFKFVNKTGYGSRLWVDNINFKTSPVSVYETEVENSLKVYPSPTSGEININFHTSKVQNHVVDVKNVLGQTIFSETLNNFTGEYVKTLNLPKNVTGMLILSIRTGDAVVSKKVMKY